jgi:hypothetical protein
MSAAEIELRLFTCYLPDVETYSSLTPAELTDLDRRLARKIRDQLAIVRGLENGSFIIYTSTGWQDFWHCHLPDTLPRERAKLAEAQNRRRALRPFRKYDGGF